MGNIKQIKSPLVSDFKNCSSTGEVNFILVLNHEGHYLHGVKHSGNKFDQSEEYNLIGQWRVKKLKNQ